MAADGLAAMLEPLRQQWRDSPLLRLGALVIVAILVWYGHVRMTEWNDALEAEARRLQERVVRLEALEGSRQWLDRAERATDLAASLEERLWQASTRGIGQANFQSWLERARAQTGLGDLSQQVGSLERLDGLAGVYRTRVRLEGQFRPGALWNFLQRVEGHKRAVWVEELEIRGERVTLALAAPIEPVAETTEADDA